MEYQNEIEIINKSIDDFNSYLNEKYYVNRFNIETDLDRKSIVKVIHKDWEAFPFPNNGTRGVYFILGHKMKNAVEHGIYIGKASLNSNTSSRLYGHLHPDRGNDFFTMGEKRENGYIIDYIASIDLDRIGLHFMAPALEEFLILSLREKINLLNDRGN